MGIFQSGKVIFYHPCNDKAEYTQTQDWTESTPTYTAGKVSNALAPTGGDASLANPSGIGDFGTETEFLSAGAANTVSASALDSTRFVVTYKDGADSNNGTARIGTVSGTNITFGTEAEYFTGTHDWPSSLALSATVFVVLYSDQDDAGHGTAKVGTVSGTDITFGAEVEYVSTADEARHNGLAKLSASKFVVAYLDRIDNQSKAKVGTVSGTDITFGAEAVFLASLTNYLSVAAGDASSFVVVYRAGGQGTARVGTVAGTDITFGAASLFNTANTDWIGATALSSTAIVAVYRDLGNSNKGTGRVGTVSGADITWGAEVVFSSGAASEISVAKVSSTEVVVAYQDNADSGHGTAKIGTVAGTDITWSAEKEFLSVNGAGIPQPTVLDSTTVVVAYQDLADSTHGTAKALISTADPYPTVVSETKVAFCGWFQKPSG